MLQNSSVWSGACGPAGVLFNIDTSWIFISVSILYPAWPTFGDFFQHGLQLV
jgi:hypothetical protein